MLITTTAGYIGQLSLLTLAGREMSTDHSAVMRCGRVVNNNNNNNNNHDNIYGAIIMTEVIARVHSVCLMNVDCVIDEGKVIQCITTSLWYELFLLSAVNTDIKQGYKRSRRFHL